MSTESTQLHVVARRCRCLHRDKTHRGRTDACRGCECEGFELEAVAFGERPYIWHTRECMCWWACLLGAFRWPETAGREAAA